MMSVQQKQEGEAMYTLVRKAILGIGTSTLLLAGAAQAETNDPVLFGMVMPFSGPAATYGAEARQGAELAVEEINAAGGILGGRKVQLVFEDDKGTTQGAVAATQKQISVNRVDAILGGMGSQLALAQSSVAKNRMLLVNTAAQADAITEQGNSWLFQINSTTSANARAFNKYIVDVIKPKTVAFIGENTEFARPLLEMLKADLAAANIELVNASMYEADINDYTSILTKVKSLNPDLVYVADGAPARLSQLWKQVSEIGGFRGEVTVPGVITPAVIAASGDALEGVVTGDIFSAEEKRPETEAFIAAFRDKYKVTPSKVHLVVYVGTKLVAAAMDKAGTSTDYAKISQTLRDNTWASARGAMTFDEKGRAIAPYFYIQKVQGPSLVLVDRVNH
jgi:branched-chain amino acid transport system substrate-binding protein